MQGALLHNGGDWTTPTCDAYYEFLQRKVNQNNWDPQEQECQEEVNQNNEDPQEQERKRQEEQERKRREEQERRRTAVVNQNLMDLQADIGQASISIAGKYVGPNYSPPLDNLELLSGSNTYDNARGSMTVKWMDFFGTTHKVTVGVGQQVNAYFPIVDRSWFWWDGDGRQRTGFNEACKWVQATFLGTKGGMFQDDYVRISAKCYKMKGEPDGGSLMTEIKQMFGDTAEIVGHVADIVQSGADSANAVISVYANYKAAKMGIPKQV